METFGIILSLPGALFASLVYRCLLVLGVVRSRTVFGPGFYVAHRLCFFLGVPALGNLLVLSKRQSILTRWDTAPFACAAFSFSLGLVEYAVYEGLYGVDGIGGPFGVDPGF